MSFTGKVPKACPGNCTNPKQGKCNSKTGVCSCTEGYVGEKCDGKFITL